MVFFLGLGFVVLVVLVVFFRGERWLLFGFVGGFWGFGVLGVLVVGFPVFGFLGG